MSDDSEISMSVPAAANQTICSNCHSTMPSELRFCRNCGFRLTNSLGAYPGAQYPDVPSAGPVAVPMKRKRRMSGMSWLFVGLLIFFVCAAAFTALVAPMRKASNVGFVTTPVVKSYIGVDGFDDTDQGVIIKSVTAPNGPADKAGLIGGDVILSFDGQKVENEDQIEDLMTKTPIGKTVNVEYTRDGEKKTTNLTTISSDEYRRITRELDRRPEGRASFGFEPNDAERVPIPGTKMYGVRLDTVLRSRPADLAGVKEGDIVVEWDGVPIRTNEEMLMRLRRALPYSTVKLVVMRHGDGEKLEKLEIPVKLGKQ